MQLSLNTLLQGARFSLQNPRGAARFVVALALPIGTLWAVLVLLAVLSTLLTLVSLALSPMASDPAVKFLTGSPVGLALFELAVLLVGATLMARVGRLAGGGGSFAGALSLMVWLQAILLILQVVQVVAQVILPPLADLLGLAGMGLFLWLLTNFTAELHGFRRLFPVFAGIIATGFAVSILTAVLLVTVGGLGNV